MYLKEDDERVPACAPKEELADTLSGLLRQAVRDARAIEGMPGYRLDMGTWHGPDAYGICNVCMGGAVLARTAGWDKGDRFVPGIRGGVYDKIYAINGMRSGGFAAAAQYAGSDRYATRRDVYNKAMELVVNDWSEDLDRASWTTYLKAADVLEAAGL